MDRIARHELIERLFEAASALPSAERARFLEERCDGDAELAREVDELLRLDSHAGGWLEPGGGGSDAAQESAPPADGRYEHLGEIGRGGMGVVHRVFDTRLQRELAMKELRGGPLDARGAAPSSSSHRRFLTEARITAQLDHPGIVPVHDIEVGDGEPTCFTMKLVRGEELRAVLRKVREGSDGWTLTKAVGVLLRACEAMAYAHSKRIVHRDLKPSNVMVGPFGEVYVMDWGLARELGRADERDLRPRPPEAGDGALRTMDGEVLGTPAYMSPEQALGELDAVGPQSDVYSAGAILYELLAGHPPYVETGTQPTSHGVWHRVRKGPPAPISRRAPDAPPELAAICSKAMSRAPRDRYVDMEGMAADLQAWLEGRAVQAHATGALVELTKWVRRNRLAATAIAAAVLGISIGLVVALSQWRRADVRAREVTALSAGWRLEELRRRAERLWPPRPALVPEYERWLRDAELAVAAVGAELDVDPADRASDDGTEPASSPGLGSRLDREIAATRAWIGELETSLSSAADGQSEEATAIRVKLRALEEGLAGLERERTLRESVTLRALEREVSRAELADLRELVALFLDPERGEWHGTVPGKGPGIARRLEIARRIAALADDEAASWKRVREDVRSRYAGLELGPQIGLVPLGPDPGSGLQEFWHVASGERPRRGPDGRLVIEEETGIVFVLVPGGEFHLGAQTTDPEGPNYVDPVFLGLEPRPEEHIDMEGPVHRVALDAFLLAKHETTQAQWLRMTGRNPSFYSPSAWPRFVADGRHPVDAVSFDEAEAALSCFGLTLPTEAQWEYACRAGTSGPYYFGDGPTGIERYINLLDPTALEFFERTMLTHTERDGFALTAPVGSLGPNGFGLHDMLGNLAEFCLDRYQEYESPVGRVRAGDGLRLGWVNEGRIVRGGHFVARSTGLRASARSSMGSNVPLSTGTVRAARAIDAGR